MELKKLLQKNGKHSKQRRPERAPVFEDFTGNPQNTGPLPQINEVNQGPLTLEQANLDDGVWHKLTEKPFRANAKAFFLTFAKCDTDPVVVSERIQNKYGPTAGQIKCWTVSKFHVCQERHQDGSKHLHVLLEFEDRPDVRNCTIFNDLVVPSRQANIRTVGARKGAIKQSWTNLLKYITKDPSSKVISYGESIQARLNSAKKKTSAKYEELAIEVQKGEKSLFQLSKEYPSTFMRDCTKIENFSNWYKNQTYIHEGTQLKPWQGVTVTNLIISEPEYRICKWLMQNIKQPRQHKQKQLYIHGPTNVGKTWITIQLMKYCKTFIMPLQEKGWLDNFEAGFDLVVVDEFTANSNFSLGMFNQFIEGSVYNCTRRNKSPFIKGLDYNVPVIFLSNMKPEAVFQKERMSNPLGVEAFIERCEIVELTEKHSLRFMEEELTRDNVHPQLVDLYEELGKVPKFVVPQEEDYNHADFVRNMIRSGTEQITKHLDDLQASLRQEAQEEDEDNSLIEVTPEGPPTPRTIIRQDAVFNPLYYQDRTNARDFNCSEQLIIPVEDVPNNENVPNRIYDPEKDPETTFNPPLAPNKRKRIVGFTETALFPGSSFKRRLLTEMSSEEDEEEPDEEGHDDNSEGDEEEEDSDSMDLR